MDEKIVDDRVLAGEAIAARENSYSPYSLFMVGAALLTGGGKIYRGCNIENAAYGPSNCAERTAFFKALSEGERDFRAIAVAGWPKNGERGFAYPCGVCRQVMMEFCEPQTFRVIVAAAVDDLRSHTLEELLPCGFGPGNLK
jgi:cytidine deaminase